jgi:hypothetical protein
MASTFTTNKHIEKPASGDYNNAWAAPVDADWDDIDNALGGHSAISVTGIGAGTYALTLPQYQPPNIEFTGILTANLNYQLPAGVGGLWSISNGTTGAFTLTFSVNGGGSFVLPQGQRSFLVCDGTNIALADSGIALAEAFATAADAVVTTTTEAFATAAASAALASAEAFTSALGVPVNTQNANYTVLATDNGKTIYKSGGSAHTDTIPLGLPTGFTCSFIVVHGALNLTIANLDASVGMYWSPSGATGSRTLAADGVATVTKTAAGTWYITGSGLS